MEELLVCPWIEYQQNDQTRLLFLNGSRRVFFRKFCQGKNHEIGKTLENTSVVISRQANESLSWVPKKCTLCECQGIQYESTNWWHYFHVSNRRRDCHFTQSSEPREGLAACSAKGVPSLLSYFKTLSIGPAPGIEPATSRSAVKRSTDWANPAGDFSCAIMVVTQGKEWLEMTDLDRAWGLRASRSTINTFLQTEKRV